MWVDQFPHLLLNRVDDEYLVKGPTASRLLGFWPKLFHRLSLWQSFNTGKTVLAQVCEAISEIAGYIHVI